MQLGSALPSGKRPNRANCGTYLALVRGIRIGESRKYLISLVGGAGFEPATPGLSRLPDPDVTGAVQHAIAALECVARDLCNDPNATLGQLIQRHGEILALPPPLDSATEKLWAFASQRGRHLREGHSPDRREAALVVRVAAALNEYLGAG